MEHRLRRRRKVTIDVVVYHRGTPVAIGRSRDMSVDGIFVETHAPALGLEARTGIQLAFADQVPDPSNRHRMSGVIVHATTRGVGVMLTRIDPQAESVLEAILDGGDRARRPRPRRHSHEEGRDAYSAP